MTQEDMQIRQEIISSPNGTTSETREKIYERQAFAGQLAVWDVVEPQLVRASE